MPLTVAGQRRTLTGFPRPTGWSPAGLHAASVLRASVVTRKGTEMQSTVASRRSWHAGTWLLWALAAGASIQFAPSPVYVALVIGIATLMVGTYGLDGPLARTFPLLVGIALVFAVVRVVLSAATTHGVGTVLFTTPSFTLPRILGGFTVGGPIETEVILQVAAESFVVVGLVAAFGAFNAVVSHYELVQIVPRAFYELGLVVVVALAFVPSTIESIVATREADRARTGGRPVRRGRLLRQIVPVLERGMERAMSLAESMDSRGFGRDLVGRREQGAAWAGLGALVSLGGAFVALIAKDSKVAAALAIVGVVLMLAAVVLASRASGRPRYRARHMSRADWAVGLGALCAPAALAFLEMRDDSSLWWFADPLAWPEVHVVVLVALLPLCLPLVARPPVARAASPTAHASVGRAAHDGSER